MADVVSGKVVKGQTEFDKGIDFDKTALEHLGLNDETSVAEYIENCTAILDADLEEAVRAGGFR